MRGPRRTDTEDKCHVAVLIPCYNEERTVGKVVVDFRRSLPNAVVYVYDNNSTDKTTAAASSAGAFVRRELYQGKGNVVRRMFTDIDADIYVLTDGDATYDASSAPTMIAKLLKEQLDMVVGVRIGSEEAAYRPGHRIGNWLFTSAVGHIFGRTFTDVLSGYRVLSRRFVKSFPVLSSGFEIETELTVHALALRLPVGEITTTYFKRPPESFSKLNTLRDGARIFRTVSTLYRTERPLSFFGSLCFCLALSSIALAIPLFITYLQEGVVPRYPTAVLSAAIMILAFIFLSSGLVLDTVTRGRREIKLLAYLGVKEEERSSTADSLAKDSLSGLN